MGARRSKFAFAKLVDDGGDFAGLKHAAIFVHTVATGETRQVTHPEAGVFDKVPEFEPFIGHVVSDYAPAYSPDGTTIAFVRTVQALGPDDTLYPKRGTNLWRVPQNGGDATQITTFGQPSAARIWSGVWIPGTQDLIVSYLQTERHAEPRTRQQRRRQPDARGHPAADAGDHRLRRVARRHEAPLHRAQRHRRHRVRVSR